MIGGRPDTLPDRLIAYYGDDFTGSTDVMEVLTFAGLPTVLFLDAPDAADLARFATYRAVGVAGTARSRSPAWMRAHLAPMLDRLATLRAPITQYKVCSTFDSSPALGSIGCALELGLAATRSAWCALIVGAPALRRYQAFGNLFAAVDGVGYRLDRHPTMAHHPVTPMHEADLRCHLARQISEPVALVDLVALKQGQGSAALRAARGAGARAVLFDVIDDETLVEAGRLIWQHRDSGMFAVASSGLEYALTAYWRQAGLLPPPPAVRDRGPVERLLVVSGSCSPVTAQQIERALQDGFAPVRVDAVAAADPAGANAEIARASSSACAALQDGRDALVFSARGPDDAAALRDAAGRAGVATDAAQRDVARALGTVLQDVVQRCSLTRVAVAGGDTSGEAAGRLGIYALEAAMKLDPGVPLCLGHRHGAADLEIALKGGQVGRADFFGRVKSGRHSDEPRGRQTE